MDWLDIILPGIVVLVAVALMIWRWKDSGAAFDSAKFVPALMATLAAAGAVAGTTFGDNVIVTPRGLVGLIIQAVLMGAGVVYATKTGVETVKKLRANGKAPEGDDAA